MKKNKKKEIMGRIQATKSNKALGNCLRTAYPSTILTRLYHLSNRGSVQEKIRKSGNTLEWDSKPQLKYFF